MNFKKSFENLNRSRVEIDKQTGGYLMPKVLYVDKSSRFRRLLVKWHLAKPKMLEIDVEKTLKSLIG